MFFRARAHVDHQLKAQRPMYRRLPDSKHELVRALALIMTLLLAGITISSLLSGRLQPDPVPALEARAQTSSEPQGTDPLQQLRDEWDRTVKQEDISRRAAFLILLHWLPPGSRMASGYRSPERQLEVIRSWAQRYNAANPADRIPLPPAVMKVDDSSTWAPTLHGLRQRNFIIAAPEQTPHATDRVVFDIAGASLALIEAACRQAQKEGMVIFRKIIVEPIQGNVHVEIETIDARALSQFSLRNPTTSAASSSGNSGAAAGASSSPEPPDEERNKMLQKLQYDHDNEKTDPAKQISYDLAMIDYLDQRTDYIRIKDLREDIKQHEQERQRLASIPRMNQALESINVARREGRPAEALSLAEQFIKDYPEATQYKNIAVEIRTQMKIDQAIDALVKSECSECKRASSLIDDALKESPNNESAQRIKGEITACVARCKTSFTAFIVLSVLSVVGLLAVLYFWLRPRNWVLEAIDGPCIGQVFALNKDKLIIGALGPGEDDDSNAADIVISDSNRKISRVHCVLRQHGRRVYLKDMSRNGTKINAIEIEGNRYVKLCNGDEISLADEAVLLLKYGAKGQS